MYVCLCVHGHLLYFPESPLTEGGMGVQVVKIVTESDHVIQVSPALRYIRLAQDQHRLSVDRDADFVSMLIELYAQLNHPTSP